MFLKLFVNISITYCFYANDGHNKYPQWDQPIVKIKYVEHKNFYG